MITISQQLFRETFQVLRQCGSQERECQVLWLGAQSDTDRIIQIVHSQHDSTRVTVEVDSRWLSSLWIDLAKAHRSIRAQVHTHPFEAGHSKTDDDYPIVGTPGFLSIVIPQFASGRETLRGIYVTEITDSGWSQHSPEATIAIT